MASAIMITPSQSLAERVAVEVEQQLLDLERAKTARASLESNGGIVVVNDLDEAFDLANAYGPEHLCLSVADAWTYLGKVKNAGGVFVGERSAEAIADYTAGPSHVMPTGGTARFGSPLSVNDFVKITSVVALDAESLKALSAATAAIARAEGLTAHARAVETRVAREEGDA
jgi:histidinol dehydrogenase